MTADIVERLREYAEDDHERLCQGRCYSCSCGYDDRRDPLMTEAADEIDRLRAALREIAKVTRGWEPGVWTEEEGRKYFAALFFGAQKVARAALGDKQ